MTIPGNVEIINNYLFIGCPSLEEIVLNEGVLDIREEAFAGCESLQKISIPNTVSSIDASAFNDVDTVSIVTTAGSYAETYANENGIPCEIQ